MWGIFLPVTFKRVHDIFYMVCYILFLFSFTGAHNQEVANLIKDEVLVRHPNATEEDI